MNRFHTHEARLPPHAQAYLREARDVRDLVTSPQGVALQRVLDGAAPIESVTVLKTSAVGPTIPPGFLGGQVQA